MTTELQPSPALAQKTIKGVFWSYLTFIGGKVLTFLSTMILARLLFPEQFGLVGYCLLTIQYLDILNSAGIDNALVSRRENLEEALGTIGTKQKKPEYHQQGAAGQRQRT